MNFAKTKDNAVVYLMGGVGNNLFQLNLAHELMELGLHVEINTGLLKGKGFLSKLLGWTDHQSYDALAELKLLNVFAVSENVNFFILILGYLSKIFHCKIFNVGFYGLNVPEARVCSNGHYFGYYHNIRQVNNKFMNAIKDGLKNVIKKREHIWQNLSNVRSAGVVVHVRGGDFMKDSKNLLNYAFYSEALKLLKRSNKADLLIATNDKKYADEMLGVDVGRFTESRDALDDFVILSQAKCKILSNSTFAWWAAETGDLDSIIIEVEPYYVDLDWHPQSVHKRISILRS